MENKKIIKNTKNPYIVSISFLLFILVITLWLYFYNSSLKQSNFKTQSIINEYKNSIESYKQDKQLIVYSLLESNSKTIEKLEYNSKITNFLDHLDYIKQLYDINFIWFNLNWNIISTSILIKSDDYNNIEHKLAYQKLINFISSYRKDEKSLFDLDFINRIIWYDEMKLNVNFNIK